MNGMYVFWQDVFLHYIRAFTRMMINMEFCFFFQSMYPRVCHIFLDFKVSRYIEGYSFWSI